MPGTAAMAALVRTVLGTTYPYATAHVSSGPDDVDVTPTRLHPAFHGCFDWHSSVHMHWSLVRLLEDADDAGSVALLDERLTAENGAAEAGYVAAHPSWERPYGWAWAAMLAAACARSERPAWAAATRPLYDAVAALVPPWLERLAYPIRHGDHANTAFALALVHEAARAFDDDALAVAITGRARDWFGADTDYPDRYEPSGSDFLSPALTEVELMRRVLPPGEFTAWLDGFLPSLGRDVGSPLLAVPEVRDTTDGHLVHLYGLGLSRAWVLRGVAATLDGARRDVLARSADAQVAAADEAVTGGDFMSTHWLVSFALLAADAGRPGVTARR